MLNISRGSMHVQKSNCAERVVAAMSGGVDSSVAAALLVQAGFQVIGVTLLLHVCHQNVGSACCGIEGVVKARGVAGRLGIPHYVLSRQAEFESLVLRPSWEEFARGRTPNPCLLCNELIKWGLLLDHARRLGARCIATGHYARVVPSGADEKVLARGKDRNKDQSYFLARLNNDQVRQTLFPIGHLKKKEVRDLARQFDLPSAEAPESQDACLVAPGQSFAEMLRSRFGETTVGGPIIDDEGRTRRLHTGIHQFTVGQRRGLGIPAKGRLWVKKIDRETAAVMVTSDADQLLSDGLVASGTRWLGTEPTGGPLTCDVQIRYRQEPVRARLERTGSDSVRVTFRRRVRAVTPGQAAVFFDGDRVLGSGWIDETF